MQDNTPPDHAGLPTSARLIRSTLLALVSAAVILVALVLPSQYGIDPIGIGRALGITAPAIAGTDGAMEDSKQPGPLARLAAAFLIRPAEAQTQARSEEISITLKPGQGTEVKLVMKKGAVAQFEWTANGARVNYDLHGDGGGKSISYKKGRGVPSHEGSLKAAFDGNHGWFWRNRTKNDVTVTLRVKGDFAELKRLI